jgi:hypothetical protein
MLDFFLSDSTADYGILPVAVYDFFSIREEQQEFVAAATARCISSEYRAAMIEYTTMRTRRNRKVIVA